MRGYTFTFDGKLYTWWRTIRLGRLRFTFGFKLPFRQRRQLRLICNFWLAKRLSLPAGSGT